MTRTLTIFIPCAFFVFLLIADRPFPDFLPEITGSESGLVENLQAILLVAAFIVGANLLVRRPAAASWIKAWIIAGILGALYVFLEEISYGQHYFNWNTPEYWQKINDQNETNLHNTSSWLDQKPRLLLEIGVIVGGIIVPLLRWFRPQALPVSLKPILPGNALFITALLAVLPRFYERAISIMDMDHWHLFARTSEVQELYFYYFALIYFIFLAKRPDYSQNKS